MPGGTKGPESPGGLIQTSQTNSFPLMRPEIRKLVNLKKNKKHFNNRKPYKLKHKLLEKLQIKVYEKCMKNSKNERTKSGPGDELF